MRLGKAWPACCQGENERGECERGWLEVCGALREGLTFLLSGSAGKFMRRGFSLWRIWGGVTRHLLSFIEPLPPLPLSPCTLRLAGAF